MQFSLNSVIKTLVSALSADRLKGVSRKSGILKCSDIYKYKVVQI